jgi:hypothetical protein
MKVKKLNEYEYTVLGDGESTYTVDLMSNNRKGECNCKNFAIRVLPQWRKGYDSDPCKHILQAIGYVAWHKMN